MMLLALVALASADVAVSHHNALIEFNFSWPAAVEASPALSRALRARMAGEERQAMLNARAQQAQARREGFDFAPHSFETAWRIEGRGARLISLSAETSSFTGGGHAEPGYEVFLWDRRAARPLDVHRLLGRGAMAEINPRFCTARVAALSAHLGEPPGNDPQWACPLLIEQTVGPADADEDGRFDTLRIFISRGYFDTEGYIVDLPLTVRDLAWIPGIYREGFEPR